MRLFGVDTPERGEKCYSEATAAGSPNYIAQTQNQCLAAQPLPLVNYLPAARRLSLSGQLR